MNDRYRYRAYDRDDERWPQRDAAERDFNQRYSAYEWRRYPASFEPYEASRAYYRDDDRRRYERRDLHDEGMYQGPQHHRAHESFGRRLKQVGERAMRQVKRVFRGPKGYVRSDERIREDVNDRLAQQDVLDPSDIEVSVASGEVTLVGSVASRYEKFCAEELADDVVGVCDVHNRLRVRRALTAQVAPTESTTQPTGQTPGEPRNGIRP
ncbi:MAG TPA: BON domain-containing protein [Polyangiales bacterium]|nr:BON domain-containing protein [Polyangiales bacterium]